MFVTNVVSVSRNPTPALPVVTGREQRLANLAAISAMAIPSYQSTVDSYQFKPESTGGNGNGGFCADFVTPTMDLGRTTLSGG